MFRLKNQAPPEFNKNMLTKDDIKNFEDAFLSIGNEVAFKSARNQKISAVGTETKNTKKTIPSSEDNLDNLDTGARGSKEAQLKKKATLGQIFDSVLEDEGLDINDVQPIEDGDEKTGKEFALKQVPVDEDNGIPLEVDTNVEEEFNSLSEESFTQETTPIKKVDFLKKSNDTEEGILFEDDSGFSLPEAFLTNEVTSDGIAEIEEVDETSEDTRDQTSISKYDDDDIEIKQFLQDTNSFFDLDDLDDIDDLDNIDGIDENIQFDSESALDEGEEEYRSAREFADDDEIIFIRNLDTYNIFLNQAIVEALDNDDLEDRAERLVDLVLDGASPQAVRNEVEKLLNRQVNLLNDNTIYEDVGLRKKLFSISGQLKKTTNVLIAKVFPVSIVLAIVMFYATYFIYNPIQAYINYEKGYDYLVSNNVEKSEEHFKKASSLWLMKQYFFKYADLYKEKRLYDNAHEKYKQIIFGLNEDLNPVLIDLFEKEDLFIPFSINGVSYLPANLITYDQEAFLKIIDFEIYQQTDYKTAQLFFDLWVDRFDMNKDILISFANMYLVMYTRLGDPEFLNQAQILYDKLAAVTAYSDDSLLLRARWAVRADDNEYINTIIKSIIDTNFQIKISPDVVVAYLEIIKYRLNRKEYRYTATMLDLLDKQYPNQIQVPYLYAIYYTLVPDQQLRKKALLTSIQKFSEEATLSIIDLHDYIDTHIRMAELYLYDENNILGAQENIAKAQLLFEKFEGENFNMDLYRMYFLASQIELFKGNISRADDYLAVAFDNGYKTPEMEYHMGLVSFLRQDWGNASKIFSTIITENQINLLDNTSYQEVLYLAIGNSLLMQKNYVASIVYYNKLLELLDAGLGSAEESIFTINLNGETELVSVKAKKLQIQNNIGVALYYLSQQDPFFSKNSALLQFEGANQTYQTLTRNNELYIRRNTIGIPEANITATLSSDRVDNLTIYSDISYYLNNENYWELSRNRPKTLIAN